MRVQTVRVDWIDSHLHGGWCNARDLRANAAGNGLRCQSIGYLVEEAEDYILVASSCSIDGDEEYADAIQIPRVAVVGVSYL